MALKTPTPGLRSIRNFGNDVAKVQVVIPAGDELTVSEDVAGQLTAADTSLRAADWVRTTAEPSAVEPEPTEDLEDDEKPKPAKKAARKKA